MEKNYEAVGFLPAPRVAAYFESGQVLVQLENGEPCGYLIYGFGWPALKVYQCCIQVDARRRESGAALVRRLIEVAEKRGCCTINLYCADDLESNGFWEAMGFHFAGTRDNGNRRGVCTTAGFFGLRPQFSLTFFFQQPVKGAVAVTLKDKIIAGLKEAIAYERGNPGNFKVSNYRVRIQPDRAAVTNTETGATSIMPLKK